MITKRTFKIVHLAKPGQSYKGTSFDKDARAHGEPLAAAKKLFGDTCASKKIRSRCTLAITIKEVTRGSDGELYSYRLKRVKKDKPDIVEFPGGKKVKFMYDIEVGDLSKNSKKKKETVKKGRSRVSGEKRTSIFDSLF